MRSNRWLALVAVAVSLVVGIVAYNAGLANGAAQAAAASGNIPPYVYAWGWHRPWGFGFAFPLFFLFLWFVIARAFFWGGPWHRRWYYYGHDVPPPSFEEWHRRAHERMSGDTPSRG
jgi:hypothetical protein